MGGHGSDQRRLFGSFAAQGQLQIDGETYEESLDFYTNRETKTHFISLCRGNEHQKEELFFAENWGRVPEFVHKQGLFAHNNGEYHYSEENHVYPDVRIAGEGMEQRQFIQEQRDKNGEPTVVITRSFTTGGDLPPIYYRMFPLHEVIELSQANGWACEVGYLNSDAADGIERQFGGWQKLFKINKEFFLVEEFGHSSRDVEIEGQTHRVRDTYSTRLYRYA